MGLTWDLLGTYLGLIYDSVFRNIMPFYEWGNPECIPNEHIVKASLKKTTEISHAKLCLLKMTDNVIIFEK